MEICLFHALKKYPDIDDCKIDVVAWLHTLGNEYRNIAHPYCAGMIRDRIILPASPRRSSVTLNYCTAGAHMPVVRVV